LVAGFTILASWLAVRRRPGAWLLDQLASAPLVFPAIVLAVAYLQFVLNVPLALYGTLLSIVIASMVQFLPFGMRYSYAGVLQIHRELEEASALSGARSGTTFLRIVVPLVAPALVTCWLFRVPDGVEGGVDSAAVGGAEFAGGPRSLCSRCGRTVSRRNLPRWDYLDHHHDGGEHGVSGLAALWADGALGPPAHRFAVRHLPRARGGNQNSRCEWLAEMLLQQAGDFGVGGVEGFVVDECFLQSGEAWADGL